MNNNLPLNVSLLCDAEKFRTLHLAGNLSMVALSKILPEFEDVPFDSRGMVARISLRSAVQMLRSLHPPKQPTSACTHFVIQEGVMLPTRLLVHFAVYIKADTKPELRRIASCPLHETAGYVETVFGRPTTQRFAELLQDSDERRINALLHTRIRNFFENLS